MVSEQERIGRMVGRRNIAKLAPFALCSHSRTRNAVSVPPDRALMQNHVQFEGGAVSIQRSRMAA
jgi:hypothetical protein